MATEFSNVDVHSDKPYEVAVQHEHAELFQALHDSLDRSSALQRKMREMKKHLVSIGLHYQVVAKQTKDDAKALMHLRNDALKAKTDELVARKQVETAFQLIQSLNLEISSLKRTLKDIQNDNTKLSATDQNLRDTTAGGASGYGGGVTGKLGNDFGALFAASAQPDEFVQGVFSAGPRVETFEEWKIKKWIKPSDQKKETVAVENHVVQMLAEAATAESLSRLTIDASMVDKIRKGKLHMNAYFKEKHSSGGEELSRSISMLPSVHSPHKGKSTGGNRVSMSRSLSSSAYSQARKGSLTSVGSSDSHSRSSAQGSVIV